jgi:hypothetical protein
MMAADLTDRQFSPQKTATESFVIRLCSIDHAQLEHVLASELQLMLGIVVRDIALICALET